MYLTDAEKAFASKVHLAAFATKDPTKTVSGQTVDADTDYRTDPPIQDVNGLPVLDPTDGTSSTKPHPTQPLSDVTEAFRTGVSLTTARTKPTWDTVGNKWIDGWTNGVAA